MVNRHRGGDDGGKKNATSVRHKESMISHLMTDGFSTDNKCSSMPCCVEL